MDSDSDDDRMLAQARTSREIRNHDEQFLADEDEQDELLQQSRRQTGRTAKTNQIKDDAKDTHAGDVSSPEVEHRRLKRKERRQKKKASLTEEAMRGEDGALMYEMEEGGLKEGSTTGESSDADASFELDRQALGDAQEKKARKRNCKTWICTYLGVFVGLVVLIYIAWRLSQKRRAVKEGQAFVSNGTALFAPTTILISLDGFRADFVNRGITPNLQSFIKNGVSPLYMTPSFPSVTFPNHYTIVTGLYPESHGIVGNSFWDPAMNEEFFYTDPLAMQPKWWGGEPIWVTAEKQGIRTATHMWPGSEAHILGVEPSFVDKFNGKEKLSNKVARILELLDKPGMEDPDASPKDMRPQFIASYVPNVDSMGHLYGPNSTEVFSTISQVDEMLGQLFTGLQDRNLSSIVNIIVVSDHGMATSDIQRLIQLDDILDMSLIDKTDGWPLFGLRPRDPATVQEIYDHLVTASRTHRGFDVYLRDHNMPERYHFSRNQRIAPLWLVPKTGWAIVTRSDFDVEQAKISGEVYHPIGIHGYDDEHPLMRAIFVARGPAFPHEPNSRVETFKNIEVYNIVCDSLSLTPKAGNGTLRLPLQTIGLHDAESPTETPPDPDPDADADADPTASKADDDGDAIISISPIEASSAADPHLLPPHLVGVDPIDAVEDAGQGANDDDVDVSRPVIEDKKNQLWHWVQDKFSKIKSALGIKEDEGKDEGKDD